MGQVYQAADTKLNRQWRARSWRSPLILTGWLGFNGKPKSANLNHPNICTLHNIGSQDVLSGSR